MELATLSVTQIQKEMFETLAAAEGMAVGDYLQKAVKSVEFLLREWGTTAQEEEPAVEETEVSPKEPNWTIGDKTYRSTTQKGLLLAVLQDVGYRKLFEAWPEDKTPIIYHRKPEGMKDSRGVDVKEGRYSFWVLTNHSTKTVASILQRVTSLV